MSLRKKICKRGLLFLLFAALFSLLPLNITAAKAETVAKHKIFSEKTIKKRISEIRNFMAQSVKKPKVKTAKFYDRTLEGNDKTVKFDYYLNGKDLMFAFGTGKDIEYRLYFYKKQLIRMLVDKKGEKRKTYTQLYKKLMTDYEGNELYVYMHLENIFRIKLADEYERPERTENNDLIFITGISDDEITYHTADRTYGPDGSVVSLDTESYTAKLSDNVEIRDYSDSPAKYEKRTLHWLKKNMGDYLICGITVKDGKIILIELPYMA